MALIVSMMHAATTSPVTYKSRVPIQRNDGGSTGIKVNGYVVNNGHCQKRRPDSINADCY
jgi:hypothetical protein